MAWTDRLASSPRFAQGEHNIAPAGTSLYSVEHIEAATPLRSRIARTNVQRLAEHAAHGATYESTCFVCRSNLFARRDV